MFDFLRTRQSLFSVLTLSPRLGSKPRPRGAVSGDLAQVRGEYFRDSKKWLLKLPILVNGGGLGMHLHFYKYALVRG